MLRMASTAIVTAALVVSALAHGQTVDERLQKLAGMIPAHAGHAGALAPDNLAKDRPAPPIDITGTWFVDLSEGFSHFLFGPPYPEFIGQTKADFETGQQMARERKSWRDAIGQCFPAGIPMIMTRVWPIMMIQLPTTLVMVSNFNNEFRQVFLDGRPWSDPGTIIFTYGGESHGHFEGKTLVVDTRYIETWNHYIDFGIPISEEFRVQERLRLLEQGRVLEIEYIMTDPKGWVGEWRNTKRWLRVDHTDIGQVDCLPDLNDNIPSVQAGKSGLAK